MVIEQWLKENEEKLGGRGRWIIPPEWFWWSKESAKWCRSRGIFFRFERTRKQPKHLKWKAANTEQVQRAHHLHAEWVFGWTASLQDFVTRYCWCCFPVVIPENKEDMLHPSNNALTDILVEANELFKDGMCGRFQSEKQFELVAVLVAFFKYQW